MSTLAWDSAIALCAFPQFILCLSHSSLSLNQVSKYVSFIVSNTKIMESRSNLFCMHEQ